jgi:hypothetical protein
MFWIWYHNKLDKRVRGGREQESIDESMLKSGLKIDDLYNGGWW